MPDSTRPPEWMIRDLVASYEETMRGAYETHSKYFDTFRQPALERYNAFVKDPGAGEYIEPLATELTERFATFMEKLWAEHAARGGRRPWYR